MGEGASHGRWLIAMDGRGSVRLPLTALPFLTAALQGAEGRRARAAVAGRVKGFVGATVCGSEGEGGGFRWMAGRLGGA